MSARTLVAAVTVAVVALGGVVGCSGARSLHASSNPAQHNPLATLLSDVTGSLRKAASATDTVTSVGFTMTTKTMGLKATGSGVIAFQPLAVEVNLDASAIGATTIRLVDGVIYLKAPVAQRSALGGATWLKVSPGRDSALSSINRQVQDVNPVQQVKTLLASGKAVAVGQETVGGVPTVHYKVTTSVDTLLAQVDPTQRSVLRHAYQAAGVKQITTEVWIDAQYRPHRAHVVEGGLSDTTIDYRDYNKPVKLASPPASDTQDIDALLKHLLH